MEFTIILENPGNFQRFRVFHLCGKFLCLHHPRIWLEIFYNCFMEHNEIGFTCSTFFSLISYGFKVHWVQQQHERIRKKRDYQKVRFPGSVTNSRSADPLGLRNIGSQSHIQYRSTDSHTFFSDPLFKEQWYMVSNQRLLLYYAARFIIYSIWYHIKQ